MLEYEFNEVELWSIIMTLNGEENCRNQKRLTEDLDLEKAPAVDSGIRRIIRSLRKAGLPILSIPGIGGGYFVPDRKAPEKGRAEVLAWRDYMRQRIQSECIVTNMVLKACAVYLNTKFKQLELPF